MVAVSQGTSTVDTAYDTVGCNRKEYEDAINSRKKKPQRNKGKIYDEFIMLRFDVTDNEPPIEGFWDKGTRIHYAFKNFAMMKKASDRVPPTPSAGEETEINPVTIALLDTIAYAKEQVEYPRIKAEVRHGRSRPPPTTTITIAAPMAVPPTETTTRTSATELFTTELPTVNEETTFATTTAVLPPCLQSIAKATTATSTILSTNITSEPSYSNLIEEVTMPSASKGVATWLVAVVVGSIALLSVVIVICSALFFRHRRRRAMMIKRVPMDIAKEEQRNAAAEENKNDASDKKTKKKKMRDDDSDVEEMTMLGTASVKDRMNLANLTEQEIPRQKAEVVIEDEDDNPQQQT